MRLGINIDHVATLRNARGGLLPSPLRAAQLAVKAGADIVTAHLREDRRHINDADMALLRHEGGAPLNMEMAVTPEMQAIACLLRPHAVCLVPERRLEITTEGGLDVLNQLAAITDCTKKLQDAGIQVSLFIDADMRQIEAANKTGCRAIEIHTGAYANAASSAQDKELSRIRDAARAAAHMGIQVHAGHGLTYQNVSAIALIPEIEELNIGHFLIGEAVFIGLEASVREMKRLMQAARQKAAT